MVRHEACANVYVHIWMVNVNANDHVMIVSLFPYFSSNCHVREMREKFALFNGGNRLDIDAYPQCPGLREQLTSLIRSIPNWSNMTNDEKKERVIQAHLLSDPVRCPLRLRHPPNGIEFGIGCGLCINKDKSSLTATHGDNKTWSGNERLAPSAPPAEEDEKKRSEHKKKSRPGEALITSVQQYARWKKEKVHKLYRKISNFHRPQAVSVADLHPNPALAHANAPAHPPPAHAPPPPPAQIALAPAPVRANA